MNDIEELVQFLQLGARLDLKLIAVENVLKLTGNKEVLNNICESSDLLNALLVLTYDRSSSVATNIFQILVNISATENGAIKLINLQLKQTNSLQNISSDIINICLNTITNPESEYADFACMILANITRIDILNQKVIDLIIESNHGFDKIIAIFTKNKFNQRGATLHYLGLVLCNLSRHVTVRQFILDRNKCVIQKLLPFTQYKDSDVRRHGIVGTLRNCCFEEDSHAWLLSDEVDILPYLVLPLAGNETFDDDEMEKLPLELQYLPEDKVREENADIRRMLLEAITQLCTLKENRILIRDKNIYVILRELHKWEKDRRVLLACENLIGILIRTEDEINQDNIKELEVSEDLMKKFEKIDEDFVKNN